MPSTPDKNLELDFGEPAVPAPGPREPAPASVSFEEAFPVPTPPVATPATAAPASEPRVFSVADLGRAMSTAMARTFDGDIWVEGELQQAKQGTGGHVYLGLKDPKEQARIDVTIFRQNLTERARELLEPGTRVKIRGRPSFYAPQGRVQFVGNRVEATGEGALLLALERLKKKLAAEGLFARERKRALPGEPRRIGVVTSRQGAVLHDICKVAFRRGGARILLANAQVQGAGAAESIVRAIARLRQVADVDVIIVARGGGSTDDLMCFNDERVVRAIAACAVPVVSAVGHEVDNTLTDLVADVRASTPSQAAELVVREALAQRVALAQQRASLGRAIESALHRRRNALSGHRRRVQDPRVLLAGARQHHDELASRLAGAMHRSHRAARARVAGARTRLGGLHPRVTVAAARSRFTSLRTRLEASLRTNAAARRAAVARATARLEAMSPLAVLGRGYAIATTDDGRAVRSAAEIAPGERVRVRVAAGTFVTRVVPDEEPGGA